MRGQTRRDGKRPYAIGMRYWVDAITTRADQLRAVVSPAYRKSCIFLLSCPASMHQPAPSPQFSAPSYSKKWQEIGLQNWEIEPTLTTLLCLHQQVADSGQKWVELTSPGSESKRKIAQRSLPQSKFWWIALQHTSNWSISVPLSSSTAYQKFLPVFFALIADLRNLFWERNHGRNFDEQPHNTHQIEAFWFLFPILLVRTSIFIFSQCVRRCLTSESHILR